MIWGSESWTICAHENGDCHIREGDFAGLTLSQLWRQHPELFGKPQPRRQQQEFPLLVKLIDTKEDLSLQVHPDDDYAAHNENGMSGKAECWYILACEDNASVVLGHNAADDNQLKAMIEAGRWNELIREIPIHPGDFLQLHPGTIHSIRGGIYLLETQQSCDITYRIFDYNRVSDGKPRELHIKQGLEVITVPSPEDCVIPARQKTPNIRRKLFEGDYYTIWEMKVEEKAFISQDHNFLIVCVIGGAGQIDSRPIGTGDHFILPFGYGQAVLTGKMELLMSAPPFFAV